MAGFKLPEFVGPIPCPHCQGTDCAAFPRDKNGDTFMICTRQGRRVGNRGLVESAAQNGNPRRQEYEIPIGIGKGGGGTNAVRPTPKFCLDPDGHG